MSDAELENLFSVFRIVSVDLEPLAARIMSTGEELAMLRETGDGFLAYGVSETVLGMLRVLDNDETEDEFTLDERREIIKTADTIDIDVLDLEDIEDLLDAAARRDEIIDTAIERSWGHFVTGRHAMFCY
jgi:hypothetical protein